MKLLKEEIIVKLRGLQGLPAAVPDPILAQVDFRVYFPVLAVVYEQLSSPVCAQITGELEDIQ